MSQEKYQAVFDSYPSLQEIFVIDGMPFLKESEANSHKRFATPGAKVEKITRQSVAETDADGTDGDTDPEVKEPEKPKGKKGK